MRVSKVMKDYIEEQVNAKFQPKIQELSTQVNKEEKSFRDAVDSIIEKANEEALKVLKESPITSTSDEFIRHNYYGVRSPLRDDIADLRDQARDVTKKIIVELELGGNKETLNRLLNEIKVEV